MVEEIFFDPFVWIVPVALVICIILAVLDLVFWDTLGVTVVSGLLVVMLSIIYFAVFLPPYDMDYYKTYRITGEVTNIESAFDGEDGTMSQVFVAEVKGVDHLIKSDDQRFRTLSIGDDVKLACTLQFRYFQDPWYECSFGG